MTSLLLDLRYAARMLRRSPGFTAVAVVTLALGIGANTAIFSLLDAALLRSLPYPDPDALVKVNLTAQPETGGEIEVQPWWSYPKFELLRDGATTLDGIAAYATQYYNLTGVEQPDRLAAETVSASYFRLLGVDAALGRTFRDEEDATPGAHPVVVLSHGLWQRRYGGDPQVLGQSLRLGETTLEIVGVMPRGFHGLSGVAELWAPMAMVPALSRWETALTWHGTHWHEIVARLGEGRKRSEAAAEIAALGRQLGRQFPRPGRIHGAEAIPLDALRVDPVVRRSLLVLLGAVAMVLVIGCVNVAGLLLSRAASRQRELAIRVALGANRSRLVRQLLTESLLLSALGGVGGLLLAAWAVSAFVGLVPESGDYLFDVGSVTLGWRVFLFTLGASLVTGLIFGIAPALRTSRAPRTDALKRGSTDVLGGRAAGRWFAPRSLLVSGQMALALVLLVGAGLMLQSLSHLRSVDTGFVADGLLTLRVEPDLAEPRAETALRFKADLLERLAAVPGVESVSLSNCAPLSSQCWSTDVQQVDGLDLPEPERPLLGIQYVGPDHFATLGIPLRAGRGFRPADRAGAPLVMILNETAARTLWPGQDPLGKRIVVGESVFLDGGTAEIVGVAADVKYGLPEEPVGLDAYMPALQSGPTRLMAFVKASVEPTSLIAALRGEVLAIDPDLPIYDVQTLHERTAEATARSRFASLLLAIFAGVALLLSAIGLYGVVAYRVSHRAREFGIRMALGARAGDLLRDVVGSALRLAVVGILAGSLGALAATRVLGGLLYEVSPTDPRTLIVVGGLLAAVAAAASYLPARRATRADPMVVLREE